jgi:DNA-binding MarR family transcriptional regulator
MISTPQLIETIRHFLDLSMHHAMHERVQLAKTIGLSMPQLGILMQLHHRGTCGISDLSERFDITSAAASQLVDKLVQGGLIQREEDPQDRRVKRVNLTEKGQKLIRHSMENRYRWIEGVARKLSTEEREQVNQALDILARAAEDVESATPLESGKVDK